VPGGERHIVALGGGGFTEPSAAALDAFALGLTERPTPKVCLIPTASGDASAYVAAFYKAFADRARCSHVSLFNRARELQEIVLGQDALYVGGGSTANLLALWRLHGLDALVREAWSAGTVLVGVSAGACALFEAGVSASFGAVAPLHDGIGLVEGAFCPHYEERRPTLLQMIADGLPIGFGADSGAALHFVGPELVGAVGVDLDQRAVRVSPGPTEVTLPVEVAQPGPGP
jgi:peptidase E